MGLAPNFGGSVGQQQTNLFLFLASVIFFLNSKTHKWKRCFIRGVGSLEGDNLVHVVYYYLSESEICPYKEEWPFGGSGLLRKRKTVVIFNVEKKLYRHVEFLLTNFSNFKNCLIFKTHFRLHFIGIIVFCSRSSKSHWKLTCSHHNIDEILLGWH